MHRMRLSLVGATALALSPLARADDFPFRFGESLPLPDAGESGGIIHPSVTFVTTTTSIYGGVTEADPEISVRLDVFHGNLSDLRIFLVSPEGITLTLLEDTLPTSPSPHRMTGTTFTDRAAEPMNGTNQDPFPDPDDFYSYHRAYRPDGSLVLGASITSFEGFPGGATGGDVGPEVRGSQARQRRDGRGVEPG